MISSIFYTKLSLNLLLVNLHINKNAMYIKFIAFLVFITGCHGLRPVHRLQLIQFYTIISVFARNYIKFPIRQPAEALTIINKWNNSILEIDNSHMF